MFIVTTVIIIIVVIVDFAVIGSIKFIVRILAGLGWSILPLVFYAALLGNLLPWTRKSFPKSLLAPKINNIL